MVSDKPNQTGETNMSCYTHLTIAERESLCKMLVKGCTQKEIAKELNRSESSISRELKRNNDDYSPSKAQAAYDERRKASVRKSKFDDLTLLHTVKYCMSKFYWSPQVIEKRLRLEGKPTVSFKTIYRALDNGELRDTLRYYLRRKYKKIGKAPKKQRRCFAQGIEQRPVEANERSAPGHWEGDTVYLTKEKKYLVTLVDRYSRYLLAAVVNTLETAEVNEEVCRLLESAPEVKSVTLDRGAEFSCLGDTQYASITYFAHAGAPWERGTNENTNGMLRQFLPKRRGQSEFDSSDLERVLMLLNCRPRACLKWRSPYEIAFDKILHLT